MDCQPPEDKDEEMEGIQKSTSNSTIVPHTVPTVFKWESEGNVVYLSGSFNDWNARIPMHNRYDDR